MTSQPDDKVSATVGASHEADAATGAVNVVRNSLKRLFGSQSQAAGPWESCVISVTTQPATAAGSSPTLSFSRTSTSLTDSTRLVKQPMAHRGCGGIVLSSNTDVALVGGTALHEYQPIIAMLTPAENLSSGSTFHWSGLSGGAPHKVNLELLATCHKRNASAWRSSATGTLSGKVLRRCQSEDEGTKSGLDDAYQNRAEHLPHDLKTVVNQGEGAVVYEVRFTPDVASAERGVRAWEGTVVDFFGAGGYDHGSEVSEGADGSLSLTLHTGTMGGPIGIASVGV